MMDTQRMIDSEIERCTSQLLDEYYTKRGIQFERVTDKQRQVKGIDVILTTKSGKSINVDEKAKYKGLQEEGAQLKSYSFEISRRCTDGEYRIGWFVSKESKTDYYCYAFPKLDSKFTCIKPNMQVDMFSKKDIIEIIQQETTLEHVEQVAAQMAMTNARLEKFTNFVLYKTPSYKLPEEPINILIAREYIENTPHFRRFYV